MAYTALVVEYICEEKGRTKRITYAPVCLLSYCHRAAEHDFSLYGIPILAGRVLSERAEECPRVHHVLFAYC